MNCKWFEVFFFLFLASENLCAPKMLWKTKGKITFVQKWGRRRRSGCVVLVPCEVLCFTSPKLLPGIPQSEDQHLSSVWFPDLIPQGCGPQAGGVSQGWGAMCCPVPWISSPVKLMRLSSHSVLGIKSIYCPWVVSHSTMLTAVQGTCLEVCVRLTLEIVFQ